MALSSAVEGDGGQWWAVVGGEGWGGRGAPALIRCRGRGRPDQPSSDNKPMPQVKRKLVTYHLTSTSICLPAPPGHIVREQSVRGGIFLFTFASYIVVSTLACHFASIVRPIRPNSPVVTAAARAPPSPPESPDHVIASDQPVANHDLR